MEGMEQILPINGPMNQDNDPRYIKSSDGEVISRVNMRPNSIDGKRWTNRKLKGNELIATDYHTGNPFVLPAGDNIEIGWCRDFQSDAIIYCIYNSNLKHCVLRYYQKLKKIEKIWYERPSLEFENTQVRSFVAEKMFYWCNGNQPPKSFVIDWAINYTNNPTPPVGDGKSYIDMGPELDLETDVFPLIKRPPQFAPIAQYVDSIYDPDSTTPINFNNLHRKMYDFKYSYTYLDGQESAYSPISKVPLPPLEVDVNGDWDENITKNNSILVEINTGNPYVNKIKIAVRECQDRSALGDFYIWKEIEKYSKANVKWRPDNEADAFLFLNTKQLENINTEIGNRYFDDVPLSAKDMLLLDGKYCAAVMPVKNYDLVDVDYDLEANVDEIHGTELQPGTLQFVYDSDHHSYDVTIVYFPATLYYITFSDHFYNPFTFFVDSTPFTTAEQIAHKFATDIEATAGTPGTNLAHGTHVGGVVTVDFNGTHPTWGTFNAYYYINGSAGQTVTPSLKSCQYHPFGIIYNDGFGRYNIFQGDKELFSPVEDCAHASRVRCKMTIRNKPPELAVSYRIGYLPNKSYLYFLQVPFVQAWENGVNLSYKPQETGVIKIYDIPSGYCLLLINQSIRRLREKWPNTYIADYIFQPGDRIRKVCTDVTNEILSELTVNYWKAASDPATDDPDGTITGYLIKKNHPAVDVSDYINLLEVYRPNVSVSIPDGSYNNIFYETGDEYEIIDPGLPSARHGITVYGEPAAKLPTVNVAQVLDINNNVITNAVLYLDMADVYIRNRMGVKPDLTYVSDVVEDMHYSDFFTSSGISIGRITAKIDSKQKELNSIVRGERYIEGSLINWLNVFLAQTKHFDASDIYGQITGAEEMGGTLKVLQAHKESSIMIGEVTQKQADMGDWIFIGDTVFGAVRRYEESRGTIYRRSFAVNIRYAYYFDEATGEFIRSSPNGQAAISKEYNMQNWFEKKAKALREYTGAKDVITVFDNDYEEVMVNFRMGNENETVVFCEKEGSKGWTYYGKYYSDNDVPEDFASYKDTLVSFLNGKLYLHGGGPLNTFYGKLHDCSISFSVNMYAAVTKRYSSIRISSNKNIWYVQFDIDEGENYPAQKSKLVPAYMRERENAIYSDILRSILKRNGVEDINIIHTGERMVGESMVITLSDATIQDVNLGMVQLNFLISQ